MGEAVYVRGGGRVRPWGRPGTGVRLWGGQVRLWSGQLHVCSASYGYGEGQLCLGEMLIQKYKKEKEGDRLGWCAARLYK